MHVIFWQLGWIEELVEYYWGEVEHEECCNGNIDSYSSCSTHGVSVDLFTRNWSHERMTGCDQLGEKHEAWEVFRKASFQKGPWLEPKMNCYNPCVFHETLSIWWYYCHLTIIFFFLSWVQYWDILLSGETALIKYYIMNNVCKYVRHIFHKVKMNSFLVLPDVFVAYINNIWLSDKINGSILSFPSFDAQCQYPLAVVTGLCSFILLINYFIFQVST